MPDGFTANGAENRLRRPKVPGWRDQLKCEYNKFFSLFVIGMRKNGRDEDERTKGSRVMPGFPCTGQGGVVAP